MKRVFHGGDTHCGHFAGLTPPEWHYSITGARKEVGRQQRELWSYFVSRVEDLRPFDVATFNGDLIDGKGSRSGGTELVTTDRGEQIGMAATIISLIDAPINRITYGTPYHSGQNEDWEGLLRLGVEFSINSHDQFAVDDVVFDIKHKVGSSSVPYGRNTAVAKERLWNLLWADRGQVEKADVVIRNHVHYYAFCGGNDWVAMTAPALCGLGSKFGERQCPGLVDFGFISFDVDGGSYSWEPHILPVIESAKKKLDRF